MMSAWLESAGCISFSAASSKSEAMDDGMVYQIFGAPKWW